VYLRNLSKGQEKRLTAGQRERTRSKATKTTWNQKGGARAVSDGGGFVSKKTALKKEGKKQSVQTKFGENARPLVCGRAGRAARLLRKIPKG